MFGISSVTSCHFLVSARKKRWRGEAPKIADSVTELMVKRQQLTFIKQKPTHFHIPLPRMAAAIDVETVGLMILIPFVLYREVSLIVLIGDFS